METENSASLNKFLFAWGNDVFAHATKCHSSDRERSFGIAITHANFGIPFVAPAFFMMPPALQRAVLGSMRSLAEQCADFHIYESVLGASATNVLKEAARACSKKTAKSKIGRGEKTMSRNYTVRIVTILAAFAMLLPATVQFANAKGANATVKTIMTFQNPITLGGTQLKPGDYNVAADDSKITISRNGKVVAEAPIQWKDETGKSQVSKIVSDSGLVTEIHFQGKTRYVAVSGESAGNNK